MPAVVITELCCAKKSELLRAVLLTSLDVECPCLGDFDLGLSSPVVISTRLSSGFNGCISSSLLPMPIGQKFVGDLLRSTFRSSLMNQAVMPTPGSCLTVLRHPFRYVILDLTVIGSFRS